MSSNSNSEIGVGRDLPKQRKVKSPVNFRPTEERFLKIETIRTKLGLNSRTEAIEASIDITAKQLGI